MNNIDAPRTCTKCGASKPLDAFYIKDKKTGRRYSWCRPCHNVIATALQKGKPNPLKLPPYDPQADRACKVCGETKPYAAFRAMRRTCRGCTAVADTALFAANPEKIRQRSRDSIRRHKEERNEKARAKRIANIDDTLKKERIYYQKTADKRRASVRRWTERNPDAKHIYDASPPGRAARARANAARWQRTTNAPVTLTREEWAAILATQQHMCLHCSRLFSDALKPTRDHIIPVSKGGGLTKENVAALCRPCNSRKGNRTE